MCGKRGLGGRGWEEEEEEGGRTIIETFYTNQHVFFLDFL